MAVPSALERLRFGPQASVALAHDVFMAGVSFPLSIWLRIGVVPLGEPFLRYGIWVFAGESAVVFLFSGLYRGVWRYASLPDLLAIARAVSIAILVFLAVLFLSNRLAGYPRSTLLINWFVLVFLLGAPRIAYRLFHDGNLRHVLERGNPLAVPVLLVGAGDSAESFIRAMRRTIAPFAVLGILDRPGGRAGRQIQGVPVLAEVGKAAEVVDRLAAAGRRPQRFMLADERIDREQLRALLAVAEAKGMTFARLPRLTELRQTDAEGLAAVDRPLPVAVEDLLGRPRQVLHPGPMRELIGGRRVLVTGAGGSIGGELARQIAASGPAKLVLFDHSEYLLYRIDREIRDLAPGLPCAALLGDVRDRARVGSVLAETRPELVFHAAALKHVPLAEANPVEAVRTNVEGTRSLAEACLAGGVGQMLLISTDKAVEPASIMGAGKRVAELICQALDRLSAAEGGGCRFPVVRFGNVLGSAGSVVPLFQQQLAAGGPLTVTDPEMTRYFMTTREAVELVLQAAALAWKQPRPAALFMLDMGEPVRILDLARQMIRLAGRQPGQDVAIVVTGKRPGEKLHERLHRPSEKPVATGVAGLLAIEGEAPAWAALLPDLERLAAAEAEGQVAALHRALVRLVPDYRPENRTADAELALSSARP